MAVLPLARLARDSGLGRRELVRTAVHHRRNHSSFLFYAPTLTSVAPAGQLAFFPNNILHQLLIRISLELVVSWNRLQKLMVVLNRLATVIDEVNVHALHRYSTDKGVDVRRDVLRQARLRP